MDWSFREKWDEYTWSKEIRKDELRIAGYFRALKNRLDLPGEEDMIFKQLMSQPELVPSGVKDPLRTLKLEMEELEEEAEGGAAWEKRFRNPFNAAVKIEKSVAEWNLLAAANMPLSPKVLAVTCAFGKLLSRMYNFMETDEEPETLALRKSLLKHMLHDLNGILTLLRDFNERSYDGSVADLFKEFFPALAAVREEILDKLKALK